MAREVILLDGGFSTQLVKYVDEAVDGDPLWTAKFLAKSPEKCAFVHRDFVLAGANIITTGSYQSTVEGYKNYLNIEKEESLEIIRNSVRLARKGIELAQQQAGQKFNVRVAGSVGPYGAYLHDGSEYTGSYTDKVTTEKLIAFHRPRVQALIEAGADILAFETVPCYKEAEALMKLLREFPHAKAWISFSVKNSTSVSNGESFQQNVLKCWRESNQLVAIGANCFHPSMVEPMFRDLRRNHPDLPLMVYPNNGEKYDVKAGRWLNSENCVSVETYVNEWIDMGIPYVGGCCRTDDNDIRRMSFEIKKWEERNLER